jgi:membrane-bound lytic murein transglycosylase A
VRRALVAALATLTLAACATPAREAPGPPRLPPPSSQSPLPLEPPPEPPRRIELSALPGWAAEDHDGAFEAWRAACPAIRDPALAALCFRARSLGEIAPGDGRTYFELGFQAERVAAEGVLTGYFAPVYPARDAPDEAFSAPVRPRPTDLALSGDGRATRTTDGAAYPNRADIEAQPETAPLAWMRPEEHFFLQIQGSGVLVFPDGRRMKALYAAHNGLPFVGIANLMRDRGLLARDNTSGDSIRGWLAAHRGPAADEVMRLNPRFVFFRLALDDGRPPAGAAGAPLPAGRAIAIDPAFHRYGDLFWLDGEAPLLAGAFPRYRRLVTALDTGGAIKGEVRADLYIGEGDAAGLEAGRIRHTLMMWRLVPRP